MHDLVGTAGVTARPIKGRVYRSRAHISNNAVRIFLQTFGQEYDRLRGFEPYNGTSHFRDVMHFFDTCCCYCGSSLEHGSIAQDHLIPINKDSGGLHAWGNVVPSCGDCNGSKQGLLWSDYLAKCAGVNMADRYRRIADFVKTYRYEPDIDEMRLVACELYEEVGRISQALIDAKIARCSKQLKASRPN